MPDGWRDTAVVLDDVPDGAMSAFDGAPLELVAGRMSLAALCGTLPLALAWADTTMRAKVPLILDGTCSKVTQMPRNLAFVRDNGSCSGSGRGTCRSCGA